MIQFLQKILPGKKTAIGVAGVLGLAIARAFGIEVNEAWTHACEALALLGIRLAR